MSEPHCDRSSDGSTPCEWGQVTQWEDTWTCEVSCTAHGGHWTIDLLRGEVEA